jgi:hypothetical protein
MPQIETWPLIPPAIRDHLVERMHDRKVGLDDLNRLRVWLETRPNVPEGRWFKDFGFVQTLPKTFLLVGHAARGEKPLGLRQKYRGGASLPRLLSNQTTLPAPFSSSVLSCLAARRPLCEWQRPTDVRTDLE